MSALLALQAAREAGAHVFVRGGRLVVQSRGRLPDAVLSSLRLHRDALVELLTLVSVPPNGDDRVAAWDEALADDWIALTLQRVSDWYDDLPPDCPVDGPGWDKAEALVDAAYLAHSRQALRDALENYERHARESFESWRARQTEAV